MKPVRSPLGKLDPRQTRSAVPQSDQFQLDVLARKVDVLLWGTFANSLVVAALAPATEMERGSNAFLMANWASFTWPILLSVIVLLRWPLVWRQSRSAGAVIVTVPLIVLSSLLSAGLGYHADWDRYVSALCQHSLPYGMAILVPVGVACPSLRQRLQRSIEVQMYVAAILGAYVLFAKPVSVRQEFFVQHHFAMNLLVPIAFVFPNLPRLSALRGAGVMLVLSVAAALSVTGQYRTQVITFLLMVPLATLWLNWGRRGGRIRLAFGALVATVLLLLLSTQLFSRVDLPRLWQESMLRLFQTSEFGMESVYGFGEGLRHEAQSSRGAEAMDFMGWADPKTWLIGVGAGTTWLSEFWGMEWTIVHFGPLNLVLRGGLLLAAPFMCLLCVAISRSGISARASDWAASSLVFLVAWSMAFLAHGPIPMNYTTSVLWLVLGASLQRQRHRQARLSPDRGS